MDSLVIIAGLGNPGRQYEGTRHNVGFDVIDILYDRYDFSSPKRFGKSQVVTGRIGDRRVVMAKPMTYMNLSGEAVRELVDFYKADAESSLIVINDDIDLEPGRLRIRLKGSAGGHNGLKSIIQHLGTQNFIRIRVGVGGKPAPDADLANHVLGHPGKADREAIGDAESRAADAVEMILAEGPDRAMTRYNVK